MLRRLAARPEPKPNVGSNIGLSNLLAKILGFASKGFSLFSSPVVTFTAGLLLGLAFSLVGGFHYENNRTNWFWWNRFDADTRPDDLMVKPRNETQKGLLKRNAF